MVLSNKHEHEQVILLKEGGYIGFGLNRFNLLTFTPRVQLRCECSDPIRFGGAHAVLLKLTYMTIRNVSGKQWRAATLGVENFRTADYNAYRQS